MVLRNKRIILVLLLILTIWGFTLLIEAKSNEETYQEKLAKIKPDDAKGYYELGLWCQQSKLDTHAQEMFEKVIELDPNHSGVRQKLGYIKYKNKWIKKGEELKADYEEQLALLKEDDVEGHYKLGNWCKGKKLLEEAKAEFEKVIALDANHEGARKELGYIKYKDQWVTKEEKEELENKEKGLIKYGDKWMKPEEMETLRIKDRALVKWDFIHKIKTKVFTIFTDLEDEKDRQNISQSGDNVYEAFIEFLTPYMKKEVLQKKLPLIKMYFFQTSDQMIKYCQSRNISVPSKYGFALGDESFQAKDTCETIMDSAGQVVLHEGAHILDSNLIGKWTSDRKWWLVEGIACHFQSLQKKDDKFILGERKDMWELRGPTKYFELEKFCDFNQAQWDKEIQQSGVFNIVYCQATALFRYFMQAEGGKYKEKFIQEVVINRKSSSKDLAKIFGFKSINDIEDKFIEFANTLYTQKISK